jgi:hypothetical protein
MTLNESETCAKLIDPAVDWMADLIRRKETTKTVEIVNSETYLSTLLRRALEDGT